MPMLNLESLTDLFQRGGPVMFFIAGVSLFAWLLGARAWYDAGRLRRVERARAARGSTDLAARARQERLLVHGVERLERELRLLSVLLGALPLLGLLGTVLGMLATFGVLAGQGDMHARWLAAGIRQALLTTQAGLFAAVVGFLLHAMTASRIRRLQSARNELSSSFATGWEA